MYVIPVRYIGLIVIDKKIWLLYSNISYNFICECEEGEKAFELLFQRAAGWCEAVLHQMYTGPGAVLPKCIRVGCTGDLPLS